MATALMIVDVQQGLFALRRPLHRGDEMVRRIADLLGRARAAGAPVVHIQHDGGPGHALVKDGAGFPAHPLVAPRAGELVVVKRHSSAFHGTELHRQLKDAGIDRVAVTGIQTEMCVDSACRAARALDYKVVLVADAHSTYDSPVLSARQIIAHHNRLLADGFVELAEAAHVQFQRSPS